MEDLKEFKRINRYRAFSNYNFVTKWLMKNNAKFSIEITEIRVYVTIETFNGKQCNVYVFGNNLQETFEKAMDDLISFYEKEN